jgi:gamma-glutamylcyclotransferase (GGCT)/AIG2-like uncharacterized protein YtfP
MVLDRYFFAYGSNMAIWVMSEICGQHKVVGPARLDDYRVAFLMHSRGWQGGVADVIYSPGDAVWGVLYAIGNQCHDALDSKERFGTGYTSMNVEVTLPEGGQTVHAFTYTVIDKLNEEVTPSQLYFDTMLEGAEQRGLPKDYIQYLRLIRPAKA